MTLKTIGTIVATAVGAGQGDGVVSRALGGIGGEEEVELTREQMPAHVHSFLVSENNLARLVNATVFSDGGGTAPLVEQAGERHPYATNIVVSTDSAGGNTTHNNMPPYIALHFCEFVGTSQ